MGQPGIAILLKLNGCCLKFKKKGPKIYEPEKKRVASHI
jgi:hypothetical protein